MTKELTEYEIEKQAKKQKLVRNEFLYHNKAYGKYEMPIIKKQDININEIKFLSYENVKKDDKENIDKTIHFFTYDWKFEKVYNNAEEELEKLKQYKYLLSPDFSLFTNMPLALQIDSVFKNRWCGAFWQSMGLKVIPTVSWGDEKSFEFCFDGIEEGSVVAVCTYYRENCEEEFMLGYNKMLEKIKPSAIICYDDPFPNMKGNIKSFLPTTFEWTKDLSLLDQAQFKWEKQNKNVSGLNPKDFKFFKYDDPYEKTNIKRCDVCGNMVFIDEYKCGECEHCGWEQDGSDLEKYGVGYPNLISLSRAKELYKKQQKFLPTFEDFLKNLKFYGEMEFYYNNEKFVTIRYTDNSEIEFYNENNVINKQIFNNLQEFEKNANINGKFLKDIWHNINFVNWLS